MKAVAPCSCSDYRIRQAHAWLLYLREIPFFFPFFLSASNSYPLKPHGSWLGERISHVTSRGHDSWKDAPESRWGLWEGWDPSHIQQLPAFSSLSEGSQGSMVLQLDLRHSFFIGCVLLHNSAANSAQCWGINSSFCQTHMVRYYLAFLTCLPFAY